MQEIMARVLSFGVNGTNGFPVQVEVFGINGLPGMDIIGLPDASVRESRNRVNAAVINSGRQMRTRRLTVNLAPADQKKEGPSFDLPIALGVLIASGEMTVSPDCEMDRIAVFGELSLDGSIQPVSGALPMAISAAESGISDIILPAKNAREAACIQGLRIYPASHLREVIDHLEGTEPIIPQRQISFDEISSNTAVMVDMAQIKGQKNAKRALEVAAAGGHNMLMIGIPGSGKTMMARCLPGILPPMTFEEALETTRIHSISGCLPADTGLIVTRPFRSPHHSASLVSLTGGGSNASPGEVSLAHNGVLFLDELPEFSRSALEALRQPLEDGVVSVTRIARQAQYQSSFMLIAAMNPCPCGFFGSTRKECRCTPQEIKRYLDRISGPLLDRIDIQVEVDAVTVQEIQDAGSGEASAVVAKRVSEARKTQQQRYQGTGMHCNAQLNNQWIGEYCEPSPEAQKLLYRAAEAMHLSMRAYNRILKVARTIADLSREKTIQVPHIAEAIQYRELDRKYWS